MMPYSLRQGHICQSFVLFVLGFCHENIAFAIILAIFFCYSDEVYEGDIGVQLNTHLVITCHLTLETSSLMYPSTDD